jgi:hypothetical protein
MLEKRSQLLRSMPSRHRCHILFLEYNDRTKEQEMTMFLEYNDRTKEKEMTIFLEYNDRTKEQEMTMYC